MVRHEAIGVQRTGPRREQVAHDDPINHPIIAIPEAVLVIVTALINMQRDARDDEPRMSSHANEKRLASACVDAG